MTLFLISFAGGIGALTRFVLDGIIRKQLGRNYPWGTVIINVTGSVLLGICTGLVFARGLDASYLLFIGTGFCGGYTTFSAANFETVRLIEQNRFGAALFNSIGVLVVAVIVAGIVFFIASV